MKKAISLAVAVIVVAASCSKEDTSSPSDNTTTQVQCDSIGAAFTAHGADGPYEYFFHRLGADWDIVTGIDDEDIIYVDSLTFESYIVGDVSDLVQDFGGTAYETYTLSDSLYCE